MNARPPLVSVIMAAYNHEAFVTRAAESVLGQSISDLELIVVDDGSPDATAERVAAIRDPRLRLVREARNRAVHPRNLGLSLARGQHVAFQNSDDEWLPGKLAAQLAAFRDEPGLAACFTAVEPIDANGAPLAGSWADGLFTTLNREPAAWLRQFFDRGNCLALPSVVVRRDQLVALGGFRASLVQLADLDLWVRLAAWGGLRVLPEKLTRMRILATANLSAPRPETHRRSAIEQVGVFERFLEPALLARFGEIFAELPDPGSTGGRMVALALRAVGQGGAGVAFADRTIAAVLDDAEARAEAVAAHGTGFIHDFIARRGQWAFAPAAP